MSTTTRNLPMLQVLACGGIIVTLSLGIRHGFGLWMLPITQQMGWTRETFALAIAIQNLSWGVLGIFGGMLADRYGAFRVLLGGTVLYAAGLLGMALSPTPFLFALTTGVLIGAAQAGTTYSIIYGVIGRQIAPERRSWAMGVAAAAGSFGQFLLMPIEGQIILQLGWQTALLIIVVLALMMAPLAFGLREPGFHAHHAAKRTQTVRHALAEALRHPPYLLLTAGYFVCGFQVTFIAVHLPGYLSDKGLTPQVAAFALAIVGLLNIVGSYSAGLLGQRFQKRWILAGIYATRAVVIALFLLAPISPASVYLFAAVMGLLWLSTVPPTNAVVAQIFGVQHFSMLSGFSFFSHQLGSFMGVWLGGYLYDRTGSYDVVWLIAIGLSVMATLLNLPVKETPVNRAAAHAA
ncbi:MAG: MFS transporter [Comamonas sp. SCN 65-56]|uniref:MFS transporter n=1 Tax=Comamonas sp. SCN 65-56 TaxID=1660095 RepID=UPI00086A7C7A|nr:MFS transporter [Comamonas sp. SCN 65-56]ODS92640.1 MAG: MFS transporter [Comamonas sp. SCN 65-56]